MERYIQQLIDDIHKATWNLNPPHKLWEESNANPDDELELEDMSYIEQYVEGEEQPISQITGIDQEQLPPEERLTTEQQALLATELETLLQNFHFVLDFPETFPAYRRYPFIRDFWNEEHVPLSFGESHIEFCEYDVENCPFPDFCATCREFADQMKYDEEHGGSADFDIDVADLLPSPDEMEDFFRRKENSQDEEEDEVPPDSELPF